MTVSLNATNLFDKHYYMPQNQGCLLYTSRCV